MIIRQVWVPSYSHSPSGSTRLGTARKGAHTAQKSGARQTLFKKSLSRKYATRTNALKYKYKYKEKSRRERRGTRARGPKPKIRFSRTGTLCLRHTREVTGTRASGRSRTEAPCLRHTRTYAENCGPAALGPHCLRHTRGKLWASRTGTPLPKAHARTHKRQCKSNSRGPPVGKRGRPA